MASKLVKDAHAKDSSGFFVVVDRSRRAMVVSPLFLRLFYKTVIFHFLILLFYLYICAVKNKKGDIMMQRYEGAPMNKIVNQSVLMLVSLAVLWGGYGALRASQPNYSLVAMTFNIYAFDPRATNLLKFFTNKDLVERNAMDIEGRIDKIADFIKRQTVKPDVIMIQEAWLDENKKRLCKNLQQEYPQTFYLESSSVVGQVKEKVKEQAVASMSNIWDFAASAASWATAIISPASSNPVKMDSGLLILAKNTVKILAYHAIEFEQKEGDEKLAHKGALGMRFEKNGQTYFAVNTHPQSGGANFSAVYSSQMQQIAQMIGENASRGDKVFMMGDLNQPINYYRNSKVIVDNTAIISNIFNDNPSIKAKQFVFLNPVMPLLLDIFDQEKINISETITVRYMPVEIIIYKDFADGSRNTIFNRANQKTVPYTGGIPSEAEATYFKQSTSFEGNALLDHCICTKNMILKDISFFRKEILGDMGASKPNDPATALSDHVPVMFMFQ